MAKKKQTKQTKKTVNGEELPNDGRTLEQSKFIIFSGPTFTEAEAIAEAERLFPN